MPNYLGVTVMVTCLIVIVAGAVYIGQHVHGGCLDFGVFKSCGTLIH